MHVALKSGQPTTRSLLRLDLLTEKLEYLPLNTATMRRAAGLWAEGRLAGQPTAVDGALDCDVLLAAQALQVSGVVVTENIRHLSRYVESRRWQDVESDAP
jgi:predicted nucleic acid-binding protein